MAYPFQKSFVRHIENKITQHIRDTHGKLPVMTAVTITICKYPSSKTRKLWLSLDFILSATTRSGGDTGLVESKPWKHFWREKPTKYEPAMPSTNW